jgi:hypothetical protein
MPIGPQASPRRAPGGTTPALDALVQFTGHPSDSSACQRWQLTMVSRLKVTGRRQKDSLGSGMP